MSLHLCNYGSLSFLHIINQESIPVRCVPPALVATTRYQRQWGWGEGVGVSPQLNKFEQVSSDAHQMSLVGG